MTDNIKKPHRYGEGGTLLKTFSEHSTERIFLVAVCANGDKKMKKIILMTFIAFVLGAAVYNFLPKQKIIHQSGTIPLSNKRELINNSSVIIKGTVNKILPSTWSNPNFEKGKNVRNIIQTDILINVDDVYKNKPYNDKVVTIRIDKGKVGDTTITSEGYPDFIVGEEVILFLSEDDGDLANPDENYYVLTGMLQGKFSLKESKGSEKIFTNKTDEDSAVEKDSFKLSTIKEEIKSTLGDLKKNPIPKMTKEEIRLQNEKIFGK